MFWLFFLKNRNLHRPGVKCIIYSKQMCITCVLLHGCSKGVDQFRDYTILESGTGIDFYHGHEGTKASYFFANKSQRMNEYQHSISKPLKTYQNRSRSSFGQSPKLTGRAFLCFSTIVIDDRAQTKAKEKDLSLPALHFFFSSKSTITRTEKTVK